MVPIRILAAGCGCVGLVLALGCFARGTCAPAAPRTPDPLPAESLAGPMPASAGEGYGIPMLDAAPPMPVESWAGPVRLAEDVNARVDVFGPDGRAERRHMTMTAGTWVRAGRAGSHASDGCCLHAAAPFVRGVSSGMARGEGEWTDPGQAPVEKGSL